MITEVRAKIKERVNDRDGEEGRKMSSLQVIKVEIVICVLRENFKIKSGEEGAMGINFVTRNG